MLYLLTVLLYFSLAGVFWRSNWGSPASGAARPWQKLLIALPLFLHGLLLYQSVFAEGAVNFNLANALSAILWLIVLIYWLTSFADDLLGLQVIVLPIAGVAAILPAFSTPSHTLPYTSLPAFKLHFFVSILAYSLFSIAAFHALFMTFIERRLHHKNVSPLPQFPPLLAMEKLLFRLIAVAFLLLTLTLASGILFSEELFQKPMPINHKTIFAIISWIIFAVLLVGRYIYGWRGRVAVRWILTGFIMLLLAYLGSKFVLEIILHRPAISGS